jgi:hypothetical protein
VDAEVVHLRNAGQLIVAPHQAVSDEADWCQETLSIAGLFRTALLQVRFAAKNRTSFNDFI